MSAPAIVRPLDVPRAPRLFAGDGAEPAHVPADPREPEKGDGKRIPSPCRPRGPETLGVATSITIRSTCGEPDSPSGQLAVLLAIGAEELRTADPVLELVISAHDLEHRRSLATRHMLGLVKLSELGRLKLAIDRCLAEGRRLGIFREPGEE